MNISLANAIRFLSIDMVEKANSGHPGMPMGMADIATILFKYFLKFNPHDPKWFNRDRFILSNGHGSALLYASLYLAGYEKINLNELKRFRQLGSLTAGHPEYHPECGIETTTGPLGQGIANAVGIAFSERILNARFGSNLVEHKIYVFCGDGCLMEGISQEAISIAGHYKLKNLILIFDDNEITIDGATSLCTSDNHIKRFEACGWQTIKIDGHNSEEIYQALDHAGQGEKPVFIAAKTTIGFGAPNKAASHHAHGSPLGVNEIKLTREKLIWPHIEFEVPENILKQWRNFYKRNLKAYDNWNLNFKNNGDQLRNYIEKKDLSKIAHAIEDYIKNLVSNPVNEASRVSSGKTLEVLANILPNLIGGSADLTGSNNTHVKGQAFVSSGNYNGSYIHYGVREHAMAAIMSGINLHGALIPYAGTFLTFSDYARPAIRLSALMELPTIYVMTHDSIGLGEDGPTHQPVEHLASLRAMPNLNVFRPSDAIETAQCWELAILSRKTPSILSLTRQALPQLNLIVPQMNQCSLGAYILKEFEDDLQVTIFASGSEVQIALETANLLENEGIGVRVVSVPCMDLLFKQEAEYIMMLTCNSSFKVAIEAGVAFGWERLIGAHGLFIGMESFGASAPAKDLYEHFGITPQKSYKRILSMIKK